MKKIFIYATSILLALSVSNFTNTGASATNLPNVPVKSKTVTVAQKTFKILSQQSGKPSDQGLNPPSFSSTAKKKSFWARNTAEDYIKKNK